MKKFNIGLIIVFSYLIIKGIEVVTIEKDIFCSDKTSCVYTIGSTILNSIFLISIIYTLISNYIFEKNYNYVDDDINSTYMLIGLLVIVDFILTCIYFFFYEKFVNYYRKDFLKNGLIASYVYPKIIIGILISAFVLLISLFIMVYIFDDTCCQSILKNFVTSKKKIKHKSTNNIRRKHNSIPDEAGNINNNDMLY